MNENNRNKSLWYLAGILFFLAFGLGVMFGNYWQVKKQITNESGKVDITKVLNLYSAGRSGSVNFNQFWEVWDLVKAKHIVQPVDETKLFYGALQGLVAGLDDPYSVYFPPKEAEAFTKDLSGKFEGIGAEVGLKNKQIVIIAPLSGSPAEKAGLKAGDKVFQIDGVDTYGLSLDEAINKIRGKKDTTVMLLINHENSEKVEEISIVRDTINVPTVKWEMKDDKIVYLQLSYFNENSWAEFDKAIKEFLPQSPKGIILDMRNNPGGYLDMAVKIASEWVGTGLIVSEKDNQDKGTEYQTEGTHRLKNLKTIVLVDGGSASASEIVAGALQDYNLATLVGVKTYGKGSVQDFQLLPDGSAIKLTIAHWFTPKNRQIDKNGIMPNVVLDKMFEETTSTTGVVEYKDLGLIKSLDLLE